MKQMAEEGEERVYKRPDQDALLIKMQFCLVKCFSKRFWLRFNWNTLKTKCCYKEIVYGIFVTELFECWQTTNEYFFSLAGRGYRAPSLLWWEGGRRGRIMRRDRRRRSWSPPLAWEYSRSRWDQRRRRSLLQSLSGGAGGSLGGKGFL